MIKENKMRYANIDLLKVIAIVMVIVLHTGILQCDFIANKNYISIIDYGIRLMMEGVPIFVFVNGFLLINKKEFDLKKHLLKTLKIFFILAIWAFIYVIIIKIQRSEQLNFTEIIKIILTTGTGNKYTGILWFLQNLIALYLFYPIIKTLHDKDKKIYQYLFIVIILLTVGVNFLNWLINLIISLTNKNNLVLLITYINKFQILYNGNFIVFFMLGGYAYEFKEMFENKNIRVKSIIFGLIAWILAFLFTYLISKINQKTCAYAFNYSTIFMLVMLIAWFAITYNYKDKKRWYNKFITSVGKNSLGIYLIHQLIINLVQILIDIPDNKIIKTIEVVLVLLISWGITIVLNKIPKLKSLVQI